MTPGLFHTQSHSPLTHALTLIHTHKHKLCHSLSPKDLKVFILFTLVIVANTQNRSTRMKILVDLINLKDKPPPQKNMKTALNYLSYTQRTHLFLKTEKRKLNIGLVDGFKSLDGYKPKDHWTELKKKKKGKLWH